MSVRHRPAVDKASNVERRSLSMSGLVAISVLGVAVTAVVFVRLGAVVYRRAIIRTGRRLKLREVLRPGTVGVAP